MSIIHVLLSLISVHVAMTWVLALKRGQLARVQEVLSEEPEDAGFSRIVILIPAWMESSTIARCLESLIKQTYQEWRVIVSAGGSDGTLEIAEEFAHHDERIEVIEQTPLGKNAALSDALQLVDENIIVVLDADSVVDSNWLASLPGSLNSSFDAICGNYFPLRSTWVSESEQMAKISAYCVNQQFILQGSGSIALCRDALLQAGGFPIDVTIGVDWDLDNRLKAEGYVCGFAPDAIVHTERPSTMREFWENEVRWRRAHLAAAWRHRDYHRHNPAAAMGQLCFYLVAIAAMGALVGMPLGALIWFFYGEPTLFALTCLCLFWIAGRRAALAVEVAAYKANWRLLLLAWAPIVLLFASFATSIVAIITPRKLNKHFKGPRKTEFLAAGQQGNL